MNKQPLKIFITIWGQSDQKKITLPQFGLAPCFHLLEKILPSCHILFHTEWKLGTITWISFFFIRLYSTVKKNRFNESFYHLDSWLYNFHALKGIRLSSKKVIWIICGAIFSNSNSMNLNFSVHRVGMYLNFFFYTMSKTSSKIWCFFINSYRKLKLKTSIAYIFLVKNQFSSQIFPRYKCKKRLPQLWNILLSNKNVTSRVHERNFHSEFDKYLHFPIHIP